MLHGNDSLGIRGLILVQVCYAYMHSPSYIIIIIIIIIYLYFCSCLCLPYRTRDSQHLCIIMCTFKSLFKFFVRVITSVCA